MTRDPQTIIRYDGPATAGRAMDVADLAPALLALGELVKIANKYANGDRAGIKVLVSADLEQHCFELNLHLAVTIWEQAKMLIADERIRTAKEIAEWLGIVSGAGVGLFHLVKYLRGRTVSSVTIVRFADGENEVEIRVEGRADSIRIGQAVYDLYANPEARKKAADVLRPLRTPDYASLEFKESETIVFQAHPADAPAPDLSDLPNVIPQNEHRSTIRTAVRIRKAIYEGNARWTLIYKKAFEAPVDDVSWLADFQAARVSVLPGSSLDVDLEERFITNEVGEIVGDTAYRIVKVHGVTPPQGQSRIEFRDAATPDAGTTIA